MREQFSNLIQLNEIAENLDKPEFSAVWALKDYTHHSTDITNPKFRAIVSSQRPEIISIVSNKYKIVQSSDVLKDLISALHKLGIPDVSGVVTEQRGKTYCVVMLPKFLNVDGSNEAGSKDGKDLQFGFILKNSYDGKNSLSFSAYAMRLVCSNGMTLNQSLGQVFMKKHIGNIQSGIQEAVQEMMSRIVERSEHLQEIIKKSIEDYLEDEKEIVEELKAAGFGEKIADKMAARVKWTNGKVSKWELYNALTNYFTFKKSTQAARLKNLDRAETILVSASVGAD